MEIDGAIAKFGLAVVEIDDLITILDHADLYTHWHGPSVKARDKVDAIIARVEEVRNG